MSLPSDSTWKSLLCDHKAYWILRAHLFSAVGIFLAWLGVRVLDGLTPSQNAEELVRRTQVSTARGDCEDYAVFLAVMWKAAGLRSAIVLAPKHASTLVYLPSFTRGNMDFCKTQPFKPNWFAIFIDAYWAKLRTEDGKVEEISLFVAVGIDLDSNKEVFGLTRRQLMLYTIFLGQVPSMALYPRKLSPSRPRRCSSQRLPSSPARKIRNLPQPWCPP